MESMAVRLARVEEKLAAIEDKVDANNALAISSNVEVLKQLKALVTISDEWRGVRKLLAATGALLLGLGGVFGALLNYFSHRP